METQAMQSVVLLLMGSALILAGVFGIVEVIIRWRSFDELLPEAFDLPGHETEISSPSLVPTDQDLAIMQDMEIVIFPDWETDPGGVSQQEIIRRLRIGDPVSLIPELAQEEGRRNIRVDTLDGTIGYVSRNKVTPLLDVLTADAEARSEVSQIGHFAKDDDSVAGVWISVSTWR